jgi:hypothetical protein
VSQCNYCTWQRLKKLGYKIASDKERKKEVPTFKDGVVVVTPEGKFAAWFMFLPTFCQC